MLPFRLGYSEGVTDDDIQGTTTLFAALKIANVQVIGRYDNVIVIRSS